MLDVTELPAACDESYEAGKVFCIAGYMASPATWLQFERQWRELLETIPDIPEIHLSDLVARRQHFEGWTREQSQALQTEILRLLLFSNLRAYVTVIDLRAWSLAAATIAQLRPHRYDAAYLFAFQHQCEMMALDVPNFPPHQRVALLFDEQQEFRHRALTLHASLKESKTLDFVSHLGAIAFDSSDRHPSLQAADVLAFEARRHFMAVPYGIEPKYEREHAWRALTTSADRKTARPMRRLPRSSARMRPLVISKKPAQLPANVIILTWLSHLRLKSPSACTCIASPCRRLARA